MMLYKPLFMVLLLAGAVWIGILMLVFLLMVVGGIKLARYLFERIKQEGDRDKSLPL